MSMKAVIDAAMKNTDSRIFIVEFIALTCQLQSHLRNDLFIRDLGLLAVLVEVSFAFIPFILAQKLFLRPAEVLDFFACSFDTGGFKFEPGFCLS